ncbi:hypothetical protein LY76DRAFT_102228 [Colletotrichum caudatum]|nr:hypothetical protein LY76DRAFT_102228 [Colletotrichum caudatum]
MAGRNSSFISMTSPLLSCMNVTRACSLLSLHPHPAFAKKETLHAHSNPVTYYPTCLAIFCLNTLLELSPCSKNILLDHVIRSSTRSKNEHDNINNTAGLCCTVLY